MSGKIPAFWRKEGAIWPQRVLTPLAMIYGAITAKRMQHLGWRAPIPVVSVGNYTLGGGGKTPMILALAAAFAAHKPFILTRGYGGNSPGPLRVDPALHTARQIGDEACMMATAAPVIVARDRAAGARLAIEQGAGLLLLDDALQNPALHKDISLALIDHSFGLGNGRVFPAGPLRMPLTAYPHPQDAVVITNSPSATQALAEPQTLPKPKPIPAHLAPPQPLALPPEIAALPLFQAALVPDPAAAGRLVGRKVVAYSGIALPEKFEATLRNLGAQIVASRHFGDHHAFSERECRALLALAEQHKAQLVTTQKDFARLGQSPTYTALAAHSAVLPVQMHVPEDLLRLIAQKIQPRVPSTLSTP